jgi:hypothetical protein
MPPFYPIEHGGPTVSVPRRPVDQGAVQQLSVVRRTFTLASQTTSDTFNFFLPAGFRPTMLRLDPSVTLGSTTLAIGNATTAAKYRAAATLTAPAIAALPLGASVQLAAQEEVIVAIGAATAPASGTLTIEMVGTYD